MKQEDFTPSQQYAERRARTEDSLLLHIKELQAGQKELTAKMNYHHAIFREEVENSVNRVFERAFPDGDPEGHKLHHELVIKREEQRLEFWMSMKKEVTKWGLVGVLGFLAVSAWQAFLLGPKK